VGPGTGYFSLHVARTVPHGQLILFDIQREMLAKSRARLRRASVTNVGYAQGNGIALPFKAHSFDVAFFVAVMGEVPDPAACIEAVGRILRPGGTLSITELPGDPDAVSQSDVTAIAEAKGFQIAEVFPLSRGFTSNFRRPSR